jgi:hypothetical protein
VPVPVPIFVSLEGSGVVSHRQQRQHLPRSFRGNGSRVAIRGCPELVTCIHFSGMRRGTLSTVGERESHFRLIGGSNETFLLKTPGGLFHNVGFLH